MSYTTTHHPNEEALCNCALHECDDELREHIAQCAQCSEYVEEIRSISHDIASIEDEPVPERLHRAVISMTHGRKKKRFSSTMMQIWSINPLSMSMLATGVILVLYAVLFLLL